MEATLITKTSKIMDVLAVKICTLQVLIQQLDSSDTYINDRLFEALLCVDIAERKLQVDLEKEGAE